MKFYTPKYKQLDLDLLCSTLDGLDKANRWWLWVTSFRGQNSRRNTIQCWTTGERAQETNLPVLLSAP